MTEVSFNVMESILIRLNDAFDDSWWWVVIYGVRASNNQNISV